MIYATFFYRDLRNTARGILMGRNIRSAPTLFSNTDLPAYAALGIIKYAFMPSAAEEPKMLRDLRRSVSAGSHYR